MTTEPRDMTPVNRLLWLRDELEREDIVDLLREDFDDLSLPALRLLAAYTKAVAALTAAAPDETMYLPSQENNDA